MFTIGTIITGVVGFLTLAWKIYTSVSGAKDPTTDQLVASNTEAQDQLKQEQTANAVDTQADATRIAGDAAVVRDLATAQAKSINSPLDAATRAKLAQQFPNAGDDN